MGHGAISVFTVTSTSGALSSTVADLGRAWKTIYLEVPTMPSGSVRILASSDNSTFRRLMMDVVNTTSVQINTMTIDSIATQRMVPIPGGYRYAKVESTSGVTDAVTYFKFICSDT